MLLCVPMSVLRQYSVGPLGKTFLGFRSKVFNLVMQEATV